MRFHGQSRTAAHRSARLAALVAAFSLAGCGGASDEAAAPATSEAASATESASAESAPSAGETVAAGSDAERWAAEFCGTVSRWREDVREVVSTVPGAIRDAASREEAEAAVGATLQSIAEDSRAAAGEIADAELPDTENRAALEDELDGIQQSIDDAGTAMDEALGEDQTLRQFVSSVDDAVMTAEQSLKSISEGWDEIGQLDVGADVAAALQEDADCQALDRDVSTRSTLG